MSPIIPSRYGHPKYNIFPQKSRSASLGGFKSSQRGVPGSDSKSRRKQRIEESKITVQAQEDDDGDNFFSKHLATARFQRNHRLINILFSEAVVPADLDPCPGVDPNHRLQACKGRMKLVLDHQKKLDDEIVDLDEKFNAKKAKIAEEGKNFADKLSEFITKSKKELEVLRANQEIRRQQESVIRLERAKNAQNSKNNTSDVNLPNGISPAAYLSNSSTTLKSSIKEEPMDISIDGEKTDEISTVLDGILDSVANAV